MRLCRLGISIYNFCVAHAIFSEAAHSFTAFEGLCEVLVQKIAPAKSAYLSTTMEWLGFNFDTLNMEITLSEFYLGPSFYFMTKNGKLLCYFFILFF